MRLLAAFSLAVCLLAPPAFAAGKKQDQTTLTFHLEVEQTEGSRFAFPQQIAGQTRYFSSSADIGTKEIATLQPFAANDGVSYGLVVKLTQTGTSRLAALSGANIDRLMLTMLNGRRLDVLQIDQMINDGTIVVWSGISADDIAQLDRLAPRPGEDPKAWKKRIKSQ